MKKRLPYICSAALSLVLCGVVLLVPMGEGALWQRSCVNGYSLFATAFFVMNTIGLCLMISDGENLWKKPYTAERPDIEMKKRRATGVVLAFFELPLLLTVFFVGGGWKMVACSVLFVGGSLILGGLIGEWSASRLRKEYAATEQRELEEQLRKEEEGYR